MVNKLNELGIAGLVGGLSALVLAFGFIRGDPINDNLAEKARQTVVARKNEANYLAQRTPESYDPATEISGRVDNVRSCDGRMCIDMTLGGEAYTVMVDAPCDYPLPGKDISAEGVGTYFPNQIYAPGCGWEYVE